MNIKSLPLFFKKGEKPETEFRLGLEWEVFVVDENTLQLVPYSGVGGIEAILKEIAREKRLNVIVEGGFIKALDGGDFRITLEPGGQIELSGTPFTKIRDCLAECLDFIGTLDKICRRFRERVMPFPYHPINTTDAVSYIPNVRYEHLTRYFKKFGMPLARNMQKLTTSVQVSIDYSSENDFSRKMKLAYLMAPVLSALYSNSPFCENRDSGYSTFRGHVWDNTDDRRCGFIDNAILKAGLTYETYCDVLLDVPMVMGFGYASEDEIDGMTLREHFSKAGGEIPEKDCLEHISFFYNVVRAKNVIELRCFDNNQELDMVLTVPALVKAIFYSGLETIEKAEELFSDFLDYKLIALKRIANIHGLDGRIDDISFLDRARRLYKIARDAMEKKYKDEVRFLAPLEELLFTRGCSPSKGILRLWNEKGRNVVNIKEQLFYRQHIC